MTTPPHLAASGVWSLRALLGKLAGRESLARSQSRAWGATGMCCCPVCSDMALTFFCVVYASRGRPQRGMAPGASRLSS